MLLSHRVATIDERMCRECSRRIGRSMQSATLLTGWWGLFAMFRNALAVITNSFSLYRAANMPAPVGGPISFEKERSVFARAQTWIGIGIVGGLIASAGTELGDNAIVRTVSALVLIALGLAIALPVVSHASERLLAPVVGLGHRLSAGIPANGLWGQAGLGAVLALLWGPCVGPTLGTALVLAAGTGTLPLAMFTMAVFALGAAASLLIAGFLLGRVTRQFKAATRDSARIGRMIFGGVMVIVGLFALTGLDRVVEASLVQIMPDWLVLFATQV